MLSRYEFPERVTNSTNLPEPFGGLYAHALTSGTCRHAIYAPQLIVPAAYRKQPKGHLLMIFADCLLIASARKGEAAEMFNVPLADVICVECGVVHLYSWMKLVWGRNARAEITIPYNTVGDEEFMTALHLIRRALDTTQLETKTRRSIPEELPLKYLNALRRWTTEEEELMELAFQPELRKSWRVLFWSIERQFAPPLLVALTTRQLMLVTEEPSTRGMGETREGWYGKIYTYCPLSRIGALELAPHEANPRLNNLRLSLVNERARLLLNKFVDAETAPQFERLSRCLTERLAHQVLDRVPSDAARLIH
jgi:hypothetical protein